MNAPPLKPPWLHEAVTIPLSLGTFPDVDLLVVRSDNASRQAASLLAGFFTDEERYELAALTTENRQREKQAGKLAVKHLACDILKRWFNEVSDPSEIEVLSPGTPVSVRAPENPHLDALLRNLFFSLSHTTGFVCAAVGRQPIGVDVETISPVTEAMAQEIGGESLLRAMKGTAPESSSTHPDLLPLIMFTQKEAVLKATGVGLTKELSSVDLSDILLDTPVTATIGEQRYQALSTVAHNCIFTLACAIRPPPIPARKTVIPGATQEIMWLMDKVEGMGTTHNVGRTIRLNGPLDIPALTRSIQHLTDRHEALRSVFRDDNGQCLIDVLANITFPLPVEILQNDSSGSALDKAKARCDEEMHRRFDLGHAPLFRFILFVLGQDDHLLLLAFHHTVIDATASVVWRQELAICYRAYLSGQSPVLPPLSLQYYDFTRIQKERLTPARVSELLDFWRSHLAGAPACLELPTDHPRPPYPTFDSGTVELPLDPRLIESLRTLRAAEGVSLFVTCLATFQVLHMRLSRQDAVVIGIPFVDRRTPDTRSLVGCLVNVLPLHMDSTGATCFRDLLHRAQAAVKAAIAHHELPFPVLVEKLAPRRHAAHSPIFQTSILLLQEDTEGLALEGLSQEYHRLPAGGAACDLNLHLVIDATGAHAQFEYNRNLFEVSTIRRFADDYISLLETIANNPVEPLARLIQQNEPDNQSNPTPARPASLSQEERALLLGAWSLEDAAPIPDLCINTLFEQQAEHNPAAVAVVFEQCHLTYQQLNEKANRLAHHLRSLGVGPESRVGLCVERSLEMMVGLLAILKAGGAYVPLDPAYPGERLAAMMDDSRLSAILTLKCLEHAIRGRAIPLLLLDALPGEVEHYRPDNPLPVAKPENLAYVIYTSGSTGRPKGVMIEHRSLVNYTLAAMRRYEIAPGDRILQFASLNFDASAEEIYPCLAAGATLVLRTEEMIKTALYFLELCRIWNVTVVGLPTAYWSHLTGQIESGQLVLPPSIRMMIIGGERARPEQFAVWLKHAGRSIRLFNTYGPTETTIVATWCELTAHAAALAEEGRILPIGRPIPNARVYVLDASSKLVGIGEIGELHIGGPGLARGYLNQDTLTSERFIPDPFSLNPGSRLYRTGDRVRFLADGSLEFLGREDHQVKLRGFRIELHEIEAALARYPGILQSVVVLREDRPDDKRLVAYCVTENSLPAPDTETLRGFLKVSLPDPMLPSAFVFMEKFPLGPNGKINRDAFPPPKDEIRHGKSNTDTPRNLTEGSLAAIWCEVLGLQQVGIHDNFFDRGGHSLLGVRLITEIRASFQRDLALRTLFLAPTIAELAALLRSDIKEQRPYSHMIEVQKGKGRTPLFFIAGGGGGEQEYMVYARMMRQTGWDSTVYGFRVWGDDGRTRPHSSVSSMARTFITELRSVQPEGPFFLAGECLGGILAYEMAQQLRKQGDDVAFLGMLDTSFPDPAMFLRFASKKFQPRLKQCWDRIFQIPKPQRLAGLPDAVAITLCDMANDLGYIRSHPLPGETQDQRNRSIKKVRYTYIRTLLRYMPRPYDGPITMLLSDDFSPITRHPSTWAKFARGGWVTHNLTGNHKDYIRDHASATGRLLGECLKAAKSHGPNRPFA